MLLSAQAHDSDMFECAVFQHNAKSPTHLTEAIVERVRYKPQDLGRVLRDDLPDADGSPSPEPPWVAQACSDGFLI